MFSSSKGAIKIFLDKIFIIGDELACLTGLSGIYFGVAYHVINNRDS